MALTIKNDEAHRLTREIAAATGSSLTDAVVTALREKLASLRKEGEPTALAEEVRRIQDFVASLPVRDTRSPDEILGYDEFGLPS